MEPEAAFVTYVPPLAILLLMACFARAPWDVWKIIGAGMILVFLALLTVARRQLGNSFSITAEARSLVTTGIYTRIRHPVYVFSSAILLGFAFYLKMPWIAAALGVLLPLQFLRARREEKVLAQAFGDAYLAYREKSWF
jgi:protein-S-isoprenylcysteine O-methyltransferase Ste14